MSHGHGGKPVQMQQRAYEPSIDATVEVEHEALWEEIERRVAAGGLFLIAREQVIGGNYKRLAKLYGERTARMVAVSISNRHPRTMSRETHHAERKRIQAIMKHGVVARHGRLRWIDRLSFWLFGVPF